MSPSSEPISSADALAASKSTYDVVLIGSGILGSALAYTLSTSGRSVLLIERDLSTPDRIVGELLQPGGCMALKRLGMSDVLEGIDASRVEGYRVFWGEEEVAIPYPEESFKMEWQEEEKDGAEKIQEGRSFHHGSFVQNLRKKAVSSPGVTLIEATVNELWMDLEDPSNPRVLGVYATPKSTPSSSLSSSSTSEPLPFRASITIVTDGCFSKFRRSLLPTHVQPIVRSNFVGLVLEHPTLPAPNHGHVILRKSSLPTSTLGPVLVYQMSSTETRMLIDIRGSKTPSNSNGQLSNFLLEHVTPILPLPIIPSFKTAISKSLTSDPKYRLRSMPNSFLPPYPQGRGIEGAILAGDSLNMRHPLTGGGMTVAFNDAVILTELLGGGKVVGEVKGDKRGVVELENWVDVGERLEEWHWRRKKVSTCINVLAMALYSLFGADDENLEVLKEGCFKYFELGGSAIEGPVSLLSAPLRSLTSSIHTPPPQPVSPPFIQNSIIVPTYKEQANIEPLVKAIFGALEESFAEKTEVVIVDDNSNDGTEEEVERLQKAGWNVGVLVRKGERGLSSAVLRGFERARGEKLVVMDADLQHPPSALGDLLEALSPVKPMAIATRYGPTSGSMRNWSLLRRIISWGARSLARPLTTASDPMTGYFAIRKDAFLHSLPISSSGFKIALELLLKTPRASPPTEISYSFGLRKTGSSKLGTSVMIKYVHQLIQLYLWKLGIIFHVLVAGGIVILVKGLILFRRGVWGRSSREEWALPTFQTPGLGGGSGDKVKRRAWE